MNLLTKTEGIQVFNPSDGSLIEIVPRATEADAAMAVKRSLAAAEEWKKVPVFRRAELIRDYLGVIRENGEEIAVLQCREMGKRIAECRGELDSACRVIEGFAERAKHLYSEVLPYSQPGKEKDLIFTVREPIGSVVCIIPFNYPPVLFAYKVGPAIAAGNSVIVKPASSNPLAIQKLAELSRGIGFPDNLIQFIAGNGSEVGTWLTANPDIAAVSLTGSTQVGIDITDAQPRISTGFSLNWGETIPSLYSRMQISIWQSQKR